MKSATAKSVVGARPSIADPYLPAKIREGREDEIREFIGCNICVSMDGYGVLIRCTQNPTISEEWRRGRHPEIITGTSAKSHLSIGAGPAGLECAGARVGDHRLYQLNQRVDVDLYLESPMTSGDLAEFDVDSTVLTTGAVWRDDGVASVQQAPLRLVWVEVLTPDQIMDGKSPSGTRIAVYDDDHFYMASLIAEKLTVQGKDVTYLTPLAMIAS